MFVGVGAARVRELFKNAMAEIGLETPIAYIAHTYEEALDHQKRLDFLF